MLLNKLINISENKIESKLTPEFPIKILFSKFGIKIINKEIIIETYNRLLVPVIISIAIIQYMHKPMAIPFRPSEKFKALYIKKIQKTEKNREAWFKTILYFIS